MQQYNFRNALKNDIINYKMCRKTVGPNQTQNN